MFPELAMDRVRTWAVQYRAELSSPPNRARKGRHLRASYTTHTRGKFARAETF